MSHRFRGFGFTSNNYSSRANVIVVMLLFAAIGGYIITNSFASNTDTICPNKIAGECRPYPDTSPWNTVIPNNVGIDTKSSTYVNTLAGLSKPLTSDPFQYTVPVWIANASTPKQNLYMVRQYATYGANDTTSTSVHWSNFPTYWSTQDRDIDCNHVPGGLGPTWSNFPIPTNMVSSVGTDAHAVVWDTSTGTEFGLWRMTSTAGYSSSTAPGFPSVVRSVSCNGAGQGNGISPPFSVPNGINWTAWDGWSYKTFDATHFGTCLSDSCGRASNNPLLAGLVRRWEIDQGKIEHAIAFAYTTPSVDGSQHGRYPAVGTIYNTSGTANDIPFGGRMQLDPTISDSTIQNTWGCKQACFTIAKALQKYGMYATDGSGSSKIFIEDNQSAQWSDPTASPAGSDAAYVNTKGRDLVSPIPWSAFRVVDAPCNPSTSDCSAYTTQANSTSGQTANVWVSTAGSASCSRSSAPVLYNAGTACGSLNAAIQAANRGDIVLVKSGTYGPQRITATPAGTSGIVKISEASGEAVILGNGVAQTCQGRSTTNYQLCIEGGSYFEINGMQLGSNNEYGIEIANTNPGSAGSQYVTLKNISGETFRIIGQVSDITISGGDFGSNNEGTKPQIKKYNPGDADTSRPNLVVIENVRFHDSVCSDGQNCSTTDHTECLQLIHTQNVTIRANTFSHCEGTGSLGVTDGPHTNLKIENNIFADVGSTYACQITMNTTNLVLQFNSLGEDCFFSDNANAGPYIVKGNYGYFNASLCKSQVQYSYNVLLGSTCGGGGDRAVNALKFVNEASGDLHLLAATDAIDVGGPSCPTTDIDGDIRPQGSGCDAGADEYTSGTSTPKQGDLNGDNIVNIFDLSILLSHYGQTGQTSSTGDLNADNVVNIFDLSILLSKYGT